MPVGFSSTICGKRTTIPEHSGIYKLHEQAAATLGNANLRECVRLPWGVGRNEWIAAKTVGIFEELVRFATVLEDVCTRDTCPHMACGKQTVYRWADERNPVPRDLPAIDYIATLVQYGHEVLSDPRVLPQDGGPFPQNFIQQMETLHKRFFRVYAHAYINHFAVFAERGCEEHLNFCFKHWLFFAREFDLVRDADLRPLSKLIAKFEAAQDEVERAAQAAVAEQPSENAESTLAQPGAP